MSEQFTALTCARSCASLFYHRTFFPIDIKNTCVRSNRNYCPADVIIRCRPTRPGSRAYAPACSVCTVSGSESISPACSAKCIVLNVSYAVRICKLEMHRFGLCRQRFHPVLRKRINQVAQRVCRPFYPVMRQHNDLPSAQSRIHCRPDQLL